MNALPALEDLRQFLHVSHSQIACFLRCSQKYYYQYVLGLPTERLSVSLPFGGAVHHALELYYASIMNTGEVLDLELLNEAFVADLARRIEQTDCEVVFKKGEDLVSVIALGKAMLKAFHESAEKNLEGYKVVDVELPLSARLGGGSEAPGCEPDTGLSMGPGSDILLIGAIDLLLCDGSGTRLLAIDHKTAAQPISQVTVDQDMQMSAYAYLLRANGYLEPGQRLDCRFNVLRKLKAPKVETIGTVRTDADMARFIKLASAVANAIEQMIFLPNRSWQCTDCAYADACKHL